ncbi:lipocalin family protein [Duganella dendranthematis]|uniref:Outer membrane lipoprotein Blc n=1 Tax=Duganella dendranthematis TaxID=2728021 RepID=A0ABX6M7Q2_9BURK|nr:lipocalin family protein [Duganella dendranthematis]QJD90351.1 lipocalin family protein [Duganella dendranthematis]
MKTLLSAAALALCCGGALAAEAPLATIAALDVPRYMGTWHEIAKFPNSFQRKCVAATTATYALQKDGKVQVVNRCQTAGGDMIEATAEARQVGAATSPKLQVRFAPAWLSFLPMVWADYWVLDIADGYQLAAVGEPRREYLWILARTPTVSPAAYEALVDRLTRQGFDTSQLVKTPAAKPAP